MEKEKNQFEIGQGYIGLISCLINYTSDFEKTLIQCKKALQPFAESFDISHIEVHIKTLARDSAEIVEESHILLIEGECINQEACIRYAKHSFQNKQVILEFYPKIGQCFSPTSQEQIAFISKLLFALGEEQLVNSMLRDAVHKDYLTKIPNVNAFIDFSNQIIQQNKVSLYDAYCINIKNFKYVNMISRYMNGDDAMKQYANTLQAFAGADEIITRLGGDNYVACILRERREDFLEYIKGIPLEIQTSSGIKPITLKAIAGIYELEEGISNECEIMMAISMALQAAKHIYHKDYYLFSKELSEKILEQQQISVDFEHNLEQGEFIAYYQPKFNLEDDTICGAEALARWVRNGVVLPPSSFIPVLEKDGTICQLDFEILRQVCEQIATWLRMGKEPVRISVNLSRWHLQNKNIVADIKQILEDYHVDPKYIEIELTETLDFKEYETMTDVIDRFKEVGIATSIDDFGTGYSSLNLLKKLDVDVLKLDKSFLDEIGNEKEGRKDRILIENIINLARDFQIQVVAEGVETTEQRAFLTDVRCHMAQGYLYAKPLAVHEFEQYL